MVSSYRGPIFVLLGVALLGAIGAITAGLAFGNPVLLDVAVTLWISTGVLAGVALAQHQRANPPKAVANATPVEVVEPDAAVETETHATTDAPPPDVTVKAKEKPVEVAVRILRRVLDFREVESANLLNVRFAVGAAGLAAIVLQFYAGLPLTPPAPMMAAITAALCLCAAGLAATAVHYLAGIEPAALPEALGLCRGARVVGWVLVLAGLSIGLVWLNQDGIVQVLHYAIFLLNAVVCTTLIEKKRPAGEAADTFPLNLTVLSVLGSRTNVLAGVLDAGEQQLGIDLRSTWALTIVRRSVEPLVIGLCLAGWLSTSLTVVGVEEQGLVERLGVPVGGEPLSPGLHLHWPWPIDQVFRIPVMRVQALTVGHEGQEEGGPEDVLWAKQHAANEYTLLLGNGRDLITVDAAVQFRISDARAWRYHTQNPADALKAIAYRAVMRSTVNRTLSDALSENVVKLTGQMRSVIQQDADALGLGVEVMGFTVGGMHPPVPVAADYQAVVSAELGKVTAVVNAQAYRNQQIPNAEAYVVGLTNDARAQGAAELGKAAGEAWSFRTLESQYRSAPQEYYFRRRLETLEKVLPGRNFTVVDSRFQRDGGELWIVP